MLTTVKIRNRKGNDKPNDEFISTIRGLYFTLNFFGIWPKANSHNWSNFIWFIQSLSLGFAVFGPIAGVIAHIHETRIVVDIMGLAVSLSCTSVKWVTLATHKRTLKRLLNSMEEDWSNLQRNTMVNQNVPNGKLIMLKYARLANAYFVIYVALVTIGVANYLSDSISSITYYDNNADPNELLLIPNSWYPLDYNRTFNIKFLVITHTITGSGAALANAAIDSILVTMTLHLCAQLKILRCFIEGIRYDSSKPQYCNTKIRLMVKRHQELLGFGKLIQKSYSYIILGQSMACTLTICFLGYSFLAEMDRTDVRTTVLIKVGFICGATMQTMFSYCHVGDVLVEQSIAVAMAIYNAEWYNFTEPIKTTCLLIMIRARRPLALTGAKIFPMTLSTFTSLLKAAVSYISVLRAMDVGQEQVHPRFQ